MQSLVTRIALMSALVKPLTFPPSPQSYRIFSAEFGRLVRVAWPRYVYELRGTIQLAADHRGSTWPTLKM